MQLPQLLVATNNNNKLREIKDILALKSCKYSNLADFNIYDIAETGQSFVENALIKARYASEKTNLPVIADDSGLMVDALAGRPGIYSARYTHTGNNIDNMQKLLTELRDISFAQRKAQFYCVIVYLRHAHDPCPLIAEGSWHGYIHQQQQGQCGFGYDPIFFVPKFKCTAAELSPQIKNKYSHRAQALQQLKLKFNDILNS